MLWEEVIRETVVSVVRMLNADATMTSTSERVHLKNLGGWLGSLTLARDKPIRHKNIAFSDLLIEANKTKRLVAVIPFTCKVLAAAKDSKTFKPPNPWIMDLLSLLLEFYHHVEMKINLKFEIEVLCKALEVDMKSIEPSVLIRESEFSFEDQFLPEVPELGGFTDLSLARINGHGIRGNLGDRFSPTAVANSLPDISTRLYYPTTSSNQVTAEQTRQVFLQAAQNAIQEIIYPVVERSVTIAGISASQLVTKDFATEPDENQFRNAAHSMVKALAGSLALVTCREPLRMSMSNNVRALSRNLPGDGLPEGVILMFVNDNIDTVCKVVEEAAEKQSVAVIEDTIREGIQIRTVHKIQQRDDHFEYPTVHRYANFMPDPFKPSTGPEGLRPEQLAIYENFGPSRPIPSHGANASQDARQQLPDLPAFDSAVPSLPTPAEAPAIPRQGVPQARVPPLGLTGAAGQANGYGEPAGVEELVGEVFICAKNAPEENAKELSPTAPVRDAYDRLIRELASLHGPARDRVAEVAAQEVTRIVFTQVEDRLEVEVMVRLLADLTQLSAVAAQRLWQWFHNFEDERFLNPRITIALLKNQLVSLNRIDLILAKALRQRNPTAIEFLADLMDAVLLGEYPIALRADFAQAIEALSYWVAEEPDLEIGKQLLGRLRASSTAESTLTPPVSKQDQLEHIFDEWIHFVRADVAGKMFIAFVRQLHEQDILKDSESSAAFLRTCVDVSIAMYEQEEQSPFGSLENAYMPVDALAQLVVSLVVYQGEPDGAVKPTRPAYLDSLLSLIALIQNRHFRDRGEDANQKVFFRLYSGILCGLQGAGAALADVHDEIMVVFGKLCLALQPRYFPAFSFSWLALVSHRIFMASMLRIGGPPSVSIL
jgi:CCR4-NOT transcription complex subunit 1